MISFVCKILFIKSRFPERTNSSLLLDIATGIWSILRKNSHIPPACFLPLIYTLLLTQSPFWELLPASWQKAKIHSRYHYTFSVLFLILKLTWEKSNECYLLHFPWIFYSDINECVTIASPCGTYHYLSCENEPGTYSCRCKIGYAFNIGERKCLGNVYFNNAIKKFCAIKQLIQDY